MDGTNDDNLSGMDATFPYAPPWIWTPGVWLASL
jgi:hypothetical protein